MMKGRGILKTAQLLDLIKIKTVLGPVPPGVTGIQTDSRKIEPGNVFVCISGTAVDGHDFIGEAIRRGASLIIAEKDVSSAFDKICFVLVKQPAKVVARLVSHIFDYPAGKLSTIGVTGTNGKTTVSHIIHEILELAGHKSAVGGTLGFRLNGSSTPTVNTTSDIILNTEMLQAAVDQGCVAMTMEVSSQGIVNGRLWGIDFDIAVFTNLTHEHLDFHKTMERYGFAKGLLFSQLGQDLQKEKFAVLNGDDQWAATFSAMTPFETISYGLTPSADFHASDIVCGEEETVFLLHSPEGVHRVSTSFIGEFNVSNCLAAVSALYAYGLELPVILNHLPAVQPVAGRMEKITYPDGPTVYIDYAHTPDAIEKTINSIMPFKKSRLIVLIGGGNYRDPLKRPIMAEKASVADYVIISTNNPGKEPVSTILSNFEEGMLHENYTLIGDRREGVRLAVEHAGKDDIVLLTDKGHETSLLVGDDRIPYSDKDTVLEQLFRIHSQSS